MKENVSRAVDYMVNESTMHDSDNDAIEYVLRTYGVTYRELLDGMRSRKVWRN